MRKIALAVLFAAIAAVPALAATEGDFKAAYANAEKAEAQAKAIKNAWTVTEAALKDAQKAASEKQHEKAVGLAKHAEALAKASIRQANEQRTAWRAAVLK